MKGRRAYGGPSECHGDRGTAMHAIRMTQAAAVLGVCYVGTAIVGAVLLTALVVIGTATGIAGTFRRP